ncbi:MAG TPA: LysR family transcriptional regulator [Christensenellaceae bacterium]|jgi:DNA-binding transcriptional LysR family regulator|nr:LysR family transcriptional regulator [Christensenellaceae bacterium]
MDFRDLQYIVAIAQHQSLTKAAEALYVTQPTLSKFVKQTEQLLGQKLFRRVGKKFVLTYAGERYLCYAHEILALKNNMDQELIDIAQSKEGVLRVGFSALRGSKIILDIIPAFTSQYPNIQLKLKEVNFDSFENLLLSGELDLVFFNLPIRNSNIAYEVLTKDEILLVASSKNPIGKKAVINPNSKHLWIDIKHTINETFIMMSQDLRLYNIINSLFTEAQIVPNILFHTRNLEAASILASENFGVTFTTEAYIRHTLFKHPPALYTVGNPPIYRTFVAAYRKGSYLPNYVKDIIHLAKTHKVSADTDINQNHKQNE